MNIRLRLTLWYTAILSAILVIFGVIVYFGLSRSLLATLDNHLQREANQIINELKFEQGGDHDGHAEKYDDEVAEYVGGFRAELEYTGAGRILARLGFRRATLGRSRLF